MAKASNHKLPVYKVHDTEFRVHLREGEFQQVDDPTNKIPFDLIRDNGNHTVIIYDPKTKNAFDGTWREFMERKELVMVRLPSLINLDRTTLREIIKERGTFDFLARTDRLSFFKSLDRKVNEKAPTRKKGKSI